MLEHLKKYFTAPAVTPPLTETEDKDSQMDDQTLDAQASADKDTVASLQASLATMALELTKVAGDYAELVAANAAAATAAFEAKQTARKAALVAAVGTVKAESLATLLTLEDASFDAVMSAMHVTATKEAATEAFKEVGVEASADATKVAESNPTMDYLTAKYKPQA